MRIETTCELVDTVHRLCRLAGNREHRAERVADAIHMATGWRWVGIYSVRDGQVVNEAWAGPGPPAHPVFSASAGLTGAALRARMSIRCADVANDPRYLTNQQSTGSELSVPVVVDGVPVGTLDVESDRPYGLSVSDQRLAEELATALAGLWAPEAT